MERNSSAFLTLFLFIWGVFLFLNTYPLGVMFYFTYSSLPLLLSPCFLVERLSQKHPQLGSLFTGLLVFWMLFGFGFAYRQIGMLAENEPIFPNQTFPKYLESPYGQVFVQQEWGDKITGVLDFIEAHSARQDDIFMMHDEPSAYFLSNHHNPTRYSYAIDSAGGDGIDVVQALEGHQTRFIFYEPAQNHFNQAALNNYLNRTFIFRQALPEGVLVFERKPG